MKTPALPKAVEWENGRLRLLDQTKLPTEEAYLEISSVSVLEEAILRLSVRGAPAIGCAAAFGVVLIAREIQATLSAQQWRREFERRCEHLANTRPTAVNLRWAVERCRATVDGIAEKQAEAVLEKEALAILEEDRAMCDKMGRNGAAAIQEILKGRKSATLVTHCNTGALATAGSGTALAVIYALQQAGIEVKVYADETRPLLQGARLTAWELSRAGIDVTVICDNMAASVLRDKKADAVIVGADRIALNGDAANKIGTYGLAILARFHNVPFFVAAPTSTVDATLADGSGIPIEERARREISESNGRVVVPENAKVFNPAFDVTPISLITAIITEKGVFKNGPGPLT